MKKLTKNQKLRITRLGQGLSLEKVAKKVFLSTSFISLMETGDRKIPDFVEDILDFEQGVKWYQTIAELLADEDSECSKEDTDKALQTLNKVLRL